MLRFVSDVNFNGAVVRGLLRRIARLDLVRLQDIGLARIDDRALLEWAARENRVILTHDVTTLRKFAEDRARNGLPMPGVFEASEHLSIRQVIEDLVIVAECSVDGEWEGQVRFLPPVRILCCSRRLFPQRLLQRGTQLVRPPLNSNSEVTDELL
jgi:hypothetical protein